MKVNISIEDASADAVAAIVAIMGGKANVTTAAPSGAKKPTAPAVPAAPPADDDMITLDKLQALVVAKVKAKKGAGISAALANYGVTKITELTEDQYADVHADLTKL